MHLQPWQHEEKQKRNRLGYILKFQNVLRHSVLFFKQIIDRWTYHGNAMATQRENIQMSNKKEFKLTTAISSVDFFRPLQKDHNLNT